MGAGFVDVSRPAYCSDRDMTKGHLKLLCAGLTEPLRESAPIACELAATYCDQSDPGASCLLYHSAWQYFRLIGLFKTIASDDDFLADAVISLAETGQFDRVLISGTADYGMLARLIHFYRQVGREPQVTVMDICRTPLELNRWLADREGLRLSVVASDALAFTSRQPFDLICSHSFLGRFHTERPELVRTWRELLRPGGRIVTTTRIRPGITGITRFSAREVELFTARAFDLALNCQELGSVTAETIAAWARQYAERKINYPLESCEEVISYYVGAGMQIDRLDRASSRSDRPSGPSLGIHSERVRLIASRP